MYIDIGNGCCIRSFLPEDKTSLTRHANNIKIAGKLRDAFPHPYLEEDAREWINLATTSSPQTHFAIASGTECIGCIGLTLQEDIFSHSAEIGFWLGEEFWGKGITSNACRKLIEYGFTELGLTRIFAYVFADNPASIKVLQKSGMHQEGILIKGVRKDNVFHDTILFAITK
jgi:[ribosomal protein S5]-alanine N-acetyltransferase